MVRRLDQRVLVIRPSPPRQPASRATASHRGDLKPGNEYEVSIAAIVHKLTCAAGALAGTSTSGLALDQGPQVRGQKLGQPAGRHL